MLTLRGFGQFYGSLIAISYRAVNATSMVLQKMSLTGSGPVETLNVTLNQSDTINGTNGTSDEDSAPSTVYNLDLMLRNIDVCSYYRERSAHLADGVHAVGQHKKVNM